jgi:hypothetical protein
MCVCSSTTLKRLGRFQPNLVHMTPYIYIYINSVASVRKRTIPTERTQLVGEVSGNFADRGCCVVSTTDPYGRILGFLDRSGYFSSPVAPREDEWAPL